MLLYNHKKEFVGIDEDDLKGLGYENITELQGESYDFADLFVKKPGYIHNFKNFSWIDFILHSEAEESKAIIHAKEKNYSCSLYVSPFHFTSEQKGYVVSVKNLRLLKGAEDAQATKDLESAGGVKASAAPVAARAVPAAAVSATPSFSREDLAVTEPELPNFGHAPMPEPDEQEALDIFPAQEIDLGSSSTEHDFGAPSGIDYDSPLTLDDDLMMDETEELIPSFEIPFDDAPQKSHPSFAADEHAGEEYLSELVKSGNYTFDPKVAANELGLPVDLIEEFIGDFVAQAHEFHDDLYASVHSSDFENVQILSHKLKGVAANLRVEDALDTLTVINHSKDVAEIMPNLNQFYRIIAKLEGKELPQTSVATPAIGLKQPIDGPLMIDEEVSVISDDELYEDLLAVKESPSEPLAAASETTSLDDDDIYGDLLGGTESYGQAHATEPEVSSVPSFEDDDLYGDLLGGAESYGETYTAEPDASSVPSFEDDDMYGDLLSETETYGEAPASETQLPSFENDDLYGELLDVPDTHTAPPVQKLTLEVQRTANELGISVDLVNSFIQDFKEQIHIHQGDFEKAILNQDIQEVNTIATLLKGMSDNLRLNEISEVLKELQKESDITNTAEAFARLQAFSDQL